MYVHYGCSYLCAPKEWENFDASFTLRFEKLPFIGKRYTKNGQRFPENVRYGDIVRGLPIPNGKAEAAYASHVLEHLTLTEFHKALENTFRMLRPGGIFRTVVPDLEHLAQEYLNGLQTEQPFANIEFLRKTCLGCEERPKTPIRLLTESLRTSKHLWMWDRRSMPAVLKQHGFVDIRLCSFGDNSDPMFSLVENSSRFQHAVAVEGHRPFS